MIAIVSGVLAGLVHVLSGPDHLAAVAPLSIRSDKKGWLAGLRWGLGHAGGVFVVGILSVWLRDLLPLEWVSSWAERLVGVVLIGLGIWGIRQAFTHHVHAHEHSHNGSTHVHIHVHSHAVATPDCHFQSTHSHTHAAFAIGALHGIAGSAHFLGVLPALAFPSVGQASIYLLSYGLGTILAMVLFASMISLIAQKVGRSGGRSYQLLMGSCSLLAVAIGGCWLFF